MEFEFAFELVGGGAGLGISLLVLAGLLLRWHYSEGSPLFITSMVVFFALEALDMVDTIAGLPPFDAPGGLAFWLHVLFPLYMVSLWMFVRGLTTPQARLVWRDLVHLIPVAIACLCALPVILMTRAERVAYHDDDLLPETFIGNLAPVGEYGFVFLWVGVLIVYGSLCARRLQRHKHNIRDLFSDLEGRSLRWLDALVIIILALAWFVVLDELLDSFTDLRLRRGWSSGLFDFFLPFALGLFALRASPVLPDWTADVLEDTSAPPPEQPAAEAPAPGSADPEPASGRYARSGLTPPDLERLATRLESRVRAENLWRDPMLTLKTLSESAGMAPIHLSEVLNTHLGASFYDYVNGLRVDDACAMLAETDQTVLEISEAVGFNSKSTFNAAFKKITGKTPSGWRRDQRAMSPLSG